MPTPNKRPAPLSGLDHHTTHGHVVRSRAEAMICDWLHHNNIPHICEMGVTIDGRAYYPDFYLPGKNLWIEFAEPMSINPNKAKHDEVKRALYEKAGMNAVWLDDNDIKNIGVILGPRLQEAEDRVFTHPIPPFVYSDTALLSEMRESAKQGLATAQYNFGALYRDCNIVPRDIVETAKWWRMAAEQGFAEAQNGMGVLYFEGNGVAKNYVKSVEWTRLAAQQGLALARNNLGLMYSEGRGVPKNLRKAHMWFSLALQGGHEPARELAINAHEKLSFWGRWMARRELKCQRVDDMFRIIKKDDLAAIRRLLAKDATLASVRREHGNTPLHNARSVAVMAELIKHGAEINAKNNSGDTPLFNADDKGKVGILVGFRAKINIRNKNSDMPLHKAVTIPSANSRMTVVKELVTRGANINARNKDGNTPMDLARQGDARFMALMIMWFRKNGGKTADELDKE